MEGKTENPALYRKSRHSCQPAPATGRKQWRQMLMVDGEPPTSGDSADEDGFAIGETEQILFALALAVEQRDIQTGDHCQRLAFIGVAMGLAMGMARQFLVTLYRGGYLHDVGKVGIPDSILCKPGPLTTEEWVTMRSHTTRGEEICRHVKSLAPVLPIIRHHHERWDGSGYPDGLAGERIPLMARILQVVDIYDALANPRPYKPAYSPEDAIALIQKETDRGWRDPQVVKVFIELHHKVLSKMPRPPTGIAPGLDGMRVSLANLQRMLAAESAPLLIS